MKRYNWVDHILKHESLTKLNMKVDFEGEKSLITFVINCLFLRLTLYVHSAYCQSKKLLVLGEIFILKQ